MNILEETSWAKVREEMPGNRKRLPPIRADPVRIDIQPNAQEQ